MRFRSAQGRGALLATVLGSGVAFLDGSVVNVALPTLDRELHAGLAGLQWAVDAYLLTLASLLLIGGALGDRFGRRKVFVVGLGWFALASAVCGAAPSIELFCAARAVQGMGAALLVPGSLALLRSAFHPDDQGQAIGAWSGLSGVTTAVGPVLGGWLISAYSWRWIFLINLPLAALAVWAAQRFVPEEKPPSVPSPVDLPGAATGALGLAGVTFCLIEGPTIGWAAPAVLVAGAAGLGLLALFFVLEARGASPMLPLQLFRVRAFAGTNATTLCVYFGLGGAMFLLLLQLQRVAGYSPLTSGAALVPITLLLLALSSRVGALSSRTGPRLWLTFGPFGVATGLCLLSGAKGQASYVWSVLPGVLVMGLGLAATVAPLTSAVLSSVEARFAGVASGVNNLVARLAGLLAVALLPGVARLSTARSAEALSQGFSRAMLYSAGFCVVGGVIAFATLRQANDT